MIDLLNRCADIELQEQSRRGNEFCPDGQCLINTGECYSCLRRSFYGDNVDTYNCLIKLSLYTINYGPIYVSEIYHFLKTSQLLENNFLNKGRLINIMSLGCGFGPDYIALTKYCNNEQLNINFNYAGYDIEPLWNTITNINTLPNIYNLLDGFGRNDVDILFMNKLFSTLKNHNLDNEFLAKLQIALQSLPNGAFIVFNDINEETMGRKEFNQFAIENNLKSVKKYYFNVGTVYSRNYTEIPDTHNICAIPHNFAHSPKPTASKSIFFLYQKVA